MRRAVSAVFLLLLPFLVCATAKAPATKPSAPPTFAATTHQQIAAILDELQQSSDYPAAQKSLQALFDQAIAYSLPKDVEVLRDVDFALRMVSQLSSVPGEKRSELLKFLRQSDTLARTLVFLVNSRQDPKTVYALLERLRQSREGQLEQFASLAAAICVVHDRPLEREVNALSSTPSWYSSGPITPRM